MHYVTGWNLSKKMGINVESFKSESGDRAYRVAQ